MTSYQGFPSRKCYQQAIQHVKVLASGVGYGLALKPLEMGILNTGKPFILAHCNFGWKEIVGPQFTDWQSPVYYSVLLHEIGHAFHKHGNTSAEKDRYHSNPIPMEVEAWEFAIQQALVWDGECQTHMEHCIKSYLQSYPYGSNHGLVEWLIIQGLARF